MTSQPIVDTLEALIEVIKHQNFILAALVDVQARLDGLEQHLPPRVDTLETTMRDLLIQRAADIAADPSWEDVWEVDQSKTDLNLTHRTEP